MTRTKLFAIIAMLFSATFFIPSFQAQTGVYTLDGGAASQTGHTYVEAAYGSMRARLIPISPGIEDKYFLHGQRGDYYLLKRSHGCLTTVTDDRILNYLFNLTQRIPVAINMPVRYPQ